MDKPPEPGRLLIVDAQPGRGDALAPCLLELGFEVTTAASGVQALAWHGEQPFDLLLAHPDLTDMKLGALLGRLADGGPPPPLIALVDRDEAGAVAELLELGAADFLELPCHPRVLRARVEAHLAHRGAAEQARDDELLKLERELQIGRDIQAGFLPQTLPQPEGWEIAACFHPAREVAGDFYDAFYLINRRRIGFLVADVCDKGVSAALFMAIFRTLLRSGAQQNASLSWMGRRTGSITEDQDWLQGDPVKRRQSLPTIGAGPLMHAVAGTNSYMIENHMLQGYFATLFFGVLDPESGALLYINAGHNPPVITRPDGGQTLLGPTGPAVGMLPNVEFAIGQARLGPGDTLYAYTDGVTEARTQDGTFFTEKRLLALLEPGDASAAALVERLDGELQRHTAGTVPFDDITMMAVRRQPTEAP